MNKRWRTSVMGTKVMRGADLGTSHELLLSNICIKFRTDRGRNQELVRYKLDKLKNEEMKTALKVRVGGRFEPLIGLETTEEKWCRGRDMIREEAESILERRRRAKQQWVTEELLDACRERRKAKKTKNEDASHENKASFRQKQAFDSIWREGMIRILKDWGLEPEILETIKRLYERTSTMQMERWKEQLKTESQVARNHLEG
ncbi:uncharacterized protein [Palaemon carinicauda]|uniref:uncharacterized protein n=1 Tax=Palaemon carinicauda TaxID=392227 RepID=UPI0035B5E3BF